MNQLQNSICAGTIALIFYFIAYLLNNHPNLIELAILYWLILTNIELKEVKR